MIPEEIKSKIDLMVNAHYPISERRFFRASLEKGYSFANETIVKKDEEIKRLEGLIEDAYIQGRNDEKSLSEINGWQQFKTENHL